MPLSAGLTSHTCSRNKSSGNQAARRRQTCVSQCDERQGLSAWTLAWLITTPLSASLLSITATSPSLAPSPFLTHPTVPLPTACGNGDAARTRHLREQRSPQVFHTAKIPLNLLKHPAADVCAPARLAVSAASATAATAAGPSLPPNPLLELLPW